MGKGERAAQGQKWVLEGEKDKFLRRGKNRMGERAKQPNAPSKERGSRDETGNNDRREAYGTLEVRESPQAGELGRWGGRGGRPNL